MRILNFSKVFEDKSASVFDNMDKVYKMIKEAQEDAENEQEEPDAEEGQEQEAPPEDPTKPTGEVEDPNAEPADEESGVYVSSNEKATIAKTMLDALQATPPKPGEIPENLLNVTNANADDVIKYIQSLISLTNSVSLADNGDENGLVNTLKEA